MFISVLILGYGVKEYNSVYMLDEAYKKDSFVGKVDNISNNFNGSATVSILYNNREIIYASATKDIASKMIINQECKFCFYEVEPHFSAFVNSMPYDEDSFLFGKRLSIVIILTGVLFSTLLLNQVVMLFTKNDAMLDIIDKFY